MLLLPCPLTYGLSYQAFRFWPPQSTIDKSRLLFTFLPSLRIAWPSNMNCLQLNFGPLLIWPYDDIHSNVTQIALCSWASNSIWQDLHGLPSIWISMNFGYPSSLLLLKPIDSPHLRLIALTLWGTVTDTPHYVKIVLQDSKALLFYGRSWLSFIFKPTFERWLVHINKLSKLRPYLSWRVIQLFLYKFR